MKAVLLMAFMLWAFSGWPLPAAAENQKPTANESIEVVAQKMDADKKQRTALFSGNVVATRGEMTLYAEQLTLFFAEQGERGSQQRVERIEARGKVCVVEGGRIAKADELDYRQTEQEIVLRTNVSIQEGENLVTGDEIILDLRQNQTQVKSSEGGRIRAIFQPDQESK
jgi:lipopolysaccharide export system protein LptA